MSGKPPARARKTIEFFTPTDGPKETAKTVVGEGKGTKLGEIPNVGFKLDKVKGGADIMEDLHVLLFKSKGKLHSRKKDIKSFSGFVFPEEAKEGEVQKLSAKLGKFTLPHLNNLMDILDLPRGSGDEGTKESKIDRIIAFLEKPAVISEKDLAAQAAKKKEKSAKAKEKTAAKAAHKKADEPTGKKVAKKDKDAPAKEKAEKETKATPAKGKVEKKKGKVAPAAKGKASPAETKTASKKRKAAPEEAKPAKKSKKETEAAEVATPARKPKWPPAKALTADVESIFEVGLSNGEGMTMGKIYAQLAEKYGMTVEEVKSKKATIKSITTKYQERQEAAVEEEEEQATAAEPEGGVAQETTEEKEEDEPVPAEGDETEDMDAEVAEEVDAAEAMETDEPADKEPAGAEEPIVEHPAEDAPLIHEPVTTDEDEVCMNKTPAPAELPAETEIPPHVAESEAPIPTLSEPEVPAAPMQPTEPLPKDPTPEPTPAKVATPTAAATEPWQKIDVPPPPTAEAPPTPGKSRADSEDAIFAGLEDLP